MTAKNESSSPGSEVYVGPRPFRTGQKLYGRDRESRQMVSLLISQRLVLLHAPSGAGKTSLIHAKIVPALEKRRFEIPTYELSPDQPPQPVVIRVNRSPEAVDPADANRYVLSVLLSLELHRPIEIRRSAAELALLTIDQYLEESFPNASLEVGEETASGESFRPLLLLLDQFEELVTLDPTDEEAKRTFLRQLGAALENEGRWALFSIREDFLGSLEPYLTTIPTGLAATYHLDYLKAEIAAEAIQEPALEAGVTYEEGVVDTLIEDLRQVRVQGTDGEFEMKAGPYVEPVHLQVVCQSLWQVKGDANEIRREHLEQLSRGKGTGVDQVLASYYAGRVQRAAAEGGVAERRIRNWFGKQLIGVQKVRRPILVDEAIEFGMTTECLDVLDKAFLIRRETRSGAHWYELAHDRLMDPVVADNEEWRAEHLSSFQVQAEVWGERGRPAFLLLSGDALAEAEKEAAEDEASLTKTDRAFLAESVQEHEKAIAEQKHAQQAERIQKLRRVMAWGATVLILMAGLTGFSVYQKHLADHQKNLADQATERADWAAYSGLIAQAQGNWNQDYLRLAQEHRSQVESEYSGRLGWEYDYLRTLINTDHRSFFGHDASITSVAFHPGEPHVASGSIDGTVRIWDAATHEEIMTPPIDTENWVQCIAYNHDGNLIACGMDQPDNNVIIWDTGTREKICVLQGHDDTVKAVAFGPGDLKNLIASGSADGSVRFWDITKAVELEKQVTATHERERVVNCVEFNPEGKWVASGGADGLVQFWSIPNKKRIASIQYLTLDGEVSEVNAIAVSPDGDWIAVGGEDGQIRFWNVENLESGPIQVEDHFLAPDPEAVRPASVTSVEFSPDGTHFVAGYRNGRIRECHWNSEEPQPKWAVGSDDLISDQAHLGAVSDLAYPLNPPSGSSRMLVSGGVDCLLRTSRPRGETIPPEIRETDIIWHAEFSPDGKQIASGNADGHINLYTVSDLDAPPLVMEQTGNESQEEVWWVAYSPDGSSLASGGKDMKVKIWDIETRTLRRTFSGHTNSITCVAFSHDGKLIASSAEVSGIMIWDAAGDDSQKPVPLSEDWVTNVAFSRDDRILISSSGEDGSVGVWNMETTPPVLIKRLNGHEEVVQTLEFSKDGTRFASGSSDRTIIVWDTATLKPVLPPLRGHPAWVTSLAFHPDGKRLASGSQDNTIKLWELDTGQEVLTLKGHEDTVWSIDFSLDGQLLLSAGEDRTMKIWEAKGAESTPLRDNSINREKKEPKTVNQ